MNAQRPAQAGLRERKKAETRAALRAVAVRLYLRHGPAAVTVHDICEAAGVSARTFFNYFENKDDVILDWDDWMTAELVRTLEASPVDLRPLETMHRAIRETLTGLMADPAWRERNQLLRAHPELLPKLVRNSMRMEVTLVEGLARHHDLHQDDFYAQLVVAVGVAALRTALRRWNPDGPPEELPELLDTAFTALADGLPPPS